MNRLSLIALGLLLTGCASHKNAPVPSSAIDSQFPSSLSGRAFFSKPEEISVEGDHSEFGPSPVDELWVNAIRGGFSQDHYRYFLFRVPSLAGRGRVDVVFFNDEAKGFFVPVDIASIEPGAATFTSYSESGSGESYDVKTTLNGSISSTTDGLRIAISLDCVNKRSVLAIPAGRRQWRSRMSFREAPLENPTLQTAKKISGTIQRQ